MFSDIATNRHEMRYDAPEPLRHCYISAGWRRRYTLYRIQESNRALIASSAVFT